MNSGDRVFIDPKKVKQYQPERYFELEEYFYKEYLINRFVNDPYVLAIEVQALEDNALYLSQPSILDMTILSYASTR